jgi:hypothetical protein
LGDVTPLGDINGDGRADLLVLDAGGTRQRVAYVVLGRDAGRLDLRQPGAAATVIHGPRYAAPDDSFDTTFAGAGDVDADGLNDVVVGDAGFPAQTCVGEDHTCAGQAWVVYGSRKPPALVAVTGLDVNGITISDAFGAFVGVGDPVESANDINGDGHDDLLVGAEDSNAFFSDVVIWGRRRSSLHDILLGHHTSYATGGFEPIAATPVGDLNRDGRADLVTASDLYREPIRVVFGRHWRGRLHVTQAKPRRSYTVVRSVRADVKAIGDVNGDRIPDLLVHRARGPVHDFVVFGRGKRRSPISLDHLRHAGFAIR